MKPLNIVILSGLLAVAGTWSAGKGISTKQVVGTATVSLFFVVFQNSQPKLAESFAWLLLAGTLGAYGEDVFTAIGSVTTRSASAPTATAGTTTAGGTSANTSSGAKVGSGIGKLGF